MIFCLKLIMRHIIFSSSFSPLSPTFFVQQIPEIVTTTTPKELLMCAHEGRCKALVVVIGLSLREVELHLWQGYLMSVSSLLLEINVHSSSCAY